MKDVATVQTSGPHGTITYPGGTIPFGPGQPTLCVNDQMGYYYERSDVLADLHAGRLDVLVQLARDGMAVGMPCINVQLMERSLDQMYLVPRTIETLVESTGCAIAIDTRDPGVLAAGLEAYRPYKALCNVVNGEWDNLHTFLPIIARYGGAVGTALVYEGGVPQSVAERLMVARRIVETAESYGIAREDVAIDCICLPSSVAPASMPTTLETIAAVRDELGVATLLGTSNAGTMMPNPEVLDLAYLMAAVSCGLDVSMTNPATPLVEGMVRGIDFLMGTDMYGKGYLSWYRRNAGGVSL